MARVLVTYGSTRGSTAEIARWVGEALRRDGHRADVVPALEAGGKTDVAGYDAVVIGGALYAGIWHKDARRFARRNARALRERPVWLFSSGPLDRSAEEKDIPPVRGVARRMARLGARGHATFGGRLAADAQGVMAASLARKMAGDHRDRGHVAAWAASVSAALRAGQPSG
ncbi:flavodoxin [Sphaerisporangium krabiense]|nr:flavodoxin [Sphaerisporangium krabiense]